MWLCQEGCFQMQCSLIMQEIFPPVAHDTFRQDHRQHLLWVEFSDSIDIGKQRVKQGAIGRRNDDKLGLLLFCQLLLEMVPFVTHLFHIWSVKSYMHSTNVK